MFEKLFPKRKPPQEEIYKDAVGFKCSLNGRWYKVGSSVFVRRSPDSGGKIESGWRIREFIEGAEKVVVEKEGLGVKTLDLSEVENIQSVVATTTNQGVVVSLKLEKVPENERDGWIVYSMTKDEVILTRQGADNVSHTLVLPLNEYINNSFVK